MMDAHPAVPGSPNLKFAYEPVTIALRTLSLLGQAEHLPGVNPWLAHLAAATSPADLRTNEIVFGPLRGALVYGDPSRTLFAYVAALAVADPAALRDRALEHMRARLARSVTPAQAEHTPSAERLLTKRNVFLASAAHLARSEPFTASADPAVLEDAYELLADPPRLHATLVGHMTQLWEGALSAEWRRVEHMLSWQAQMYARALDELHELDSDIPLADVFHELTGRELPAHVATTLAGAGEVVLVPCWHLGRWVMPWDTWYGVPRLCFSEPPNADVPLLRSTPVGRGELHARMAALADETRLRILDMVRANDELSAQELVAALGLSQSNVSRHLSQLVRMGYLYERRGDGANKSYRLSAYYFARTADALRRLAEGEPFEPAPEHSDLAPQLRRFVDRTGRITTWPPAHQRDKLLILEYLAAAFEPGRRYSERELAEVFDQRSAVTDHAALRRALYEYRFMNRARDGSAYWLSGTLPESES